MNWDSENSFTLIELMLVLAIVGVLAAITVPADEIKRSRAPEALLGSMACKPAVTGNFAITTQDMVPGSAPSGACPESDA